ncbi:MAG: 4-hydroxy-3-methylbut-2-enyl diphosphate reductase [Clostridia bacterium]|nr:4-hydroxy-3-methylbut-2-enyl diphosphate reductase [Clostridia bacterium]
MKITVAKGAGFCFGVRRAYGILEEIIRNRLPGERIFTLGSFVHNPIIVEELAERGVRSIDEQELSKLFDEANPGAEVTVLMRTHGISRDIRDKLSEYCEKNTCFRAVDCTCPCVLRIHEIVERETLVEPEKTVLLILGDELHPEVQAIMSYCRCECIVFKTAAELEKLDLRGKRPVLVQQTTQLLTECKLSKNYLCKHFTNLTIYDTICKVTEERQKETAELAERVDIMLVLGGRSSSNTNKLYKIAMEHQPQTYFVENTSELPLRCISPETNLGITAGASTPDSLIEEAIKIMENMEIKDNIVTEDFAELLKESESRNIKTGDSVEGIIVSVDDREIKVDLQSNYTGVIVAEEATDDSSVKLAEQFHVGDMVVAIVTKTNDELGIANLSKRQADARASAGKLAEAYENGEVFEGKIVSAVKGGVIMNAFSTKLFIPASQTGVPKDGDLNALVGTVQEAKITELPAGRGRRAVASISVVKKAKRAAELNDFWASLEVGKVFEGSVKSITDYGVFVNLGPVDGMVHRTELTWKRFKTPSDVVSVGDVLTVYVKEYDAAAKRISLGCKTEENNPWHVFEANYNVGDVVSVKIVSIKTYGAFAEVIEGVDGLIHISEIANKKLGNPAEVLHIGDVVDAKLIEINNETHKISLSIRQLSELGADEEVVEENSEVVDAE